MVLVLAVLELCDFIVSEKEDSVLAGIKESAFIYSVQKSCLKPDNVFKHHIAAMNSTKVQNPRRNSYAGTGCRHYTMPCLTFT